MATKKNNASKKANSSKKSAKTTSRKAATDNTAKAAMSEPEVLETVECVDLTILSNKEMGLGQALEGTLRKRGRYDYLFTEQGLKEHVEHPKLVREEVARCGKVHVSINAYGVFLSGYWKKNEFSKTPLLAERLVSDTEEVGAEIRQMDLKKRMEVLGNV